MLSTLLKSRNPLSAKSAEKRLGAISELTAAGTAKLGAQLAACARADADLRVRLAAIGRIEDQALLVELLDDAAVADAAAERLADLGADADHPALLQVRMRRASSPEQAAQLAAAAAANPEALAELFLCCPETFREALLPALRRAGDQGLAALEKRSRNRDKNANRKARAERETLRALCRDSEQLRERAERLETALRKASAEGAPAQFLHLKSELQGCIEAAKQQRQDLAPYGLPGPDAEAWQELVQTLETPEPAPLPRFDALVAELRQLDERMAAGAPFEEWAPSREALARQWLAASDRSKPDPSEQAVFEEVSHRYRELADAQARWQKLGFKEAELPPESDEWPQEPEALQALWATGRNLRKVRGTLQRKLESVRWPSWSAQPAPLQAAQRHIDSLADFEQRLAAFQETLEERLDGAVQRIEACLAEGRLQAAQSALGEARKMERSLPERLARKHRKALAEGAARIDEWRDWQAFATSHKRQALLDAMQALADQAPDNPQDQAERIKALRADWNALGPLSGDGRAKQAEFDRLAERAFAPCRAHFTEQASLRKRNLAERRRICEQLESYLEDVDWRSADMRAADQIMRAARAEWRTHSPVDRKRGKELSTRFEKLQERIHAAVKKAWDRNLVLKQGIVAAAERLAASDASTAEKVEEVKALQRQWREVGITPRKPDQQLWRQFREHCDQIFVKREADEQQASQQMESVLAQSDGICEALRKALDEAEPATADRSLLARLRGELHSLNLPERRERAIRKRFDECARAYNQLILAGEAERLCAELEQLKAWDRQFSQAEAEGRAMEPPAPAFAERTAKGEEPVADLRRLTLEAEILAGIESPSADRPLRMELQVEALNRSMGRRADPRDPKGLAESWCRLGPKSEASDALRERFFQALAKLTQPA